MHIMSETSGALGSPISPASKEGSEYIDGGVHGAVRRSTRTTKKPATYADTVSKEVHEMSVTTTNQSSRKDKTVTSTLGDNTKTTKTESKEETAAATTTTSTQKVTQKRAAGDAAKTANPMKRQRTLAESTEVVSKDAENMDVDVKVDDGPSEDEDSSVLSSLAGGSANAALVKYKTLPGGVVPEKEEVLPAGGPLVWAKDRQALCETLEYYKAYQSGAYTTDGKAKGLLLAVDSSDRNHLDGEVIIARAGGHCGSDENGKMAQIKNMSKDGAQIKSFRNSMEKNLPVVILVAKDNNVSNVVFPHAYNVLDRFQVTEIWAEKNNGYTCYRYRLEKIEIMKPSWWVAQGTPKRTELPDYSFCCPKTVCITCGEASKAIFAQGWVCLTDGCLNFFKNNQGVELVGKLTYSDSFLKERKQWTSQPPLSPELRPKPFSTAGKSADFAYSHKAWEGFCCPKCGCCSKRRLWEHHKCENDSCGFVHEINQPVLTSRDIRGEAAAERVGDAKTADKFKTGVQVIKIDEKHGWHIITYKLKEGNTITHFHANWDCNTAPDGPDDMLVDIQKNKGVGLKRGIMGHKKDKHEMIANHFTANFGMHYKYYVATASQHFSQAPKSILNAREMLQWAGEYAKDVMGEAEAVEFNELLAVGYFEHGKMAYHDDGETQLGPTIGTLSLGCDASMKLRMKTRYHSGFTKSGKYDPDEPVLPGAFLEQERRDLKSQLERREITREKLQEKVLELFKLEGKSMKPPKALLTMHLSHGDMVMMHGRDMQKYYEHAVEPKGGNLRFGLTCRKVEDVSQIAEEDRRKANFDRKMVPRYDGHEFVKTPEMIAAGL